MNTAQTVPVVMRVRVHCRQFQRRQVMPSSSRHTTSPASGRSTTAAPLAVVSKGSLPSARTSRGDPTYASRSSPPIGSRWVMETAL